MLHGFTLIHDDFHDCLDDVLASLALTWGREYALMFSRGWDFEYFPSDRQANDKLGKRFSIGKDYIWDSIDRYHGIQSKCHYNKKFEEQLSVMRDELNEGWPVIVWMDPYYLRWTPCYKKAHAQHFCIAVELDEKSGIIHCLDPFWNKDINHIKISNFKSGNGKCIMLSLVDTEDIRFDWNDIIKSAVQELIGNNRKINAFDSMRLFADEVERSLDISLEINGFEEIPFMAPLIIKTTVLGLHRVNFAMALKYIAEKFKVEGLLPMVKDMKKFGRRWHKVRKIYFNGIGAEDAANTRSMAAKEIRSLAAAEERFTHRLLDLTT